MLRCSFLVIFFLTLLGTQVSKGQLPVVITATIPDPGDTLYYQVDELPKRISISSPGKNQLWNFASLVGPYLQFQTVQPSLDNTDLLTITGDKGAKAGFTQNSMTLVLKTTNRIRIGKTELKSNWTSDGGLPMPSADLEYQDNHEYSTLFQTSMAIDEAPANWLSSIPAGVDSIRVSILIDRKMSVDATGMLFLINGFRQEAERLKVKDDMTKKIWAKKPNGNWQDITSLTRLEDFQPESRTSYHFVSLETGGNLCSIELNQNGTPDKVYFVIPKEQARFYKPAANFQYLLAYPNPALSYVRFKFLDLPPGEYTLKFYDVFMRSLFQKKYDITGEETVEINISHLEKGPYLYSLVDKTGKNITTKRLIVIKP